VLTSGLAKGTSGVSSPYLSHERGSTIPSSWMCSRTAQPSACARWASSDGRPRISYERRGARPLCRGWSCAVQPSVRAKRGSSASRPDAFYVRCSAIVPVVSIYRAAVSACKSGQQRQQASHLVRALQRQAIGPAVVACRAAVSEHEKGPAASADLTFRTSDAAPPCRMRIRTAQPSARAKGASSDSRPRTSCERCSARLPCRLWLRAAQPSVRKKRASSVSRPDISYERGSAIVPEVSTYRAAARAGEKGSALRALHPFGRRWLNPVRRRRRGGRRAPMLAVVPRIKTVEAGGRRPAREVC